MSRQVVVVVVVVVVEEVLLLLLQQRKAMSGRVARRRRTKEDLVLASYSYSCMRCYTARWLLRARKRERIEYKREAEKNFFSLFSFFHSQLKVYTIYCMSVLRMCRYIYLRTYLEKGRHVRTTTYVCTTKHWKSLESREIFNSIQFIY